MNIKQNDQEMIVKASRSVKWTILYNFLPRLATPFSTLILAKLLTPADFGLIAISTFVIALARILIELGLGKAIIQQRVQVDSAASASFWTCLSLSFFLYGILWVIAPFIANLYGNLNIIGVIRVAAIALPLMGISTISKALLRRNMVFSSLFWVYTSLMFIQALVSVWFAYMDFGYWSILIGQLSGILTSSLLAVFLAHWRPTLLFNWKILSSMLGFSLWILLSGFQNWLLLYADNAIAGYFLGVSGLGIYSLGFSIAIIIPGFFSDALGDVAYPAFCQLQDDPIKIGQSLLKLQQMMALILFPIAFGLAAVAKPLINLLYGKSWPNLDVVIALLVLMPGLGYIWTMNEYAYQAIHKPHIWTGLLGISLLVLIPVLFFVAPYGLIALTIARSVSATALPLGNIFMGRRIFRLKISKQLEIFFTPLLYSLVMYVGVVILARELSPFDGATGWYKLLLLILIGCVVYISFIWSTKRELWSFLVLNIRRVVS